MASRGGRKTVSSSECDIQVYVRSALLVEPIERKVATVKRLGDDGRVNSVSIDAWPSEVVLSEHTPFMPILEDFRTFDAWAARTAVDITPAFTVETRSELGTDDTRMVLKTPVMFLAVYLGDDLITVFPHVDGEVNYSAADGIAAIKSGKLTYRPGPAAPTDGPTVCPDCDGGVVNVQGIGVCQSCHWSGIGSSVARVETPVQFEDSRETVNPDSGSG